MLHFENLSSLHTHQQYLAPVLQTQDFFIVGGSVRDVLLGITDHPTDIDITMTGKPEKIRKNMKYDDTKISRFRTEKFGTMTIIPKDNKNIHYELTPLRTEGGYGDFRHPGKITRSNDILLDAARRDFTINCLYRYHTPLIENIDQNIHSQQENLHRNIDLIKKLKQDQNIYIIENNTFILQEHNTINHLFKDGIFQKEYFKKIFPTFAQYTLGKKEDISLSAMHNTHFSFLIDPFHGIQDLISHKIRTVGDPDKRFTEDALRIMRGVRFPILLNQNIDIAQQNGFDFERKTRESMKKNILLIKHLAKERIHDELIKVFKSKNPFGYISLLDELGAIEILFPALAKTKGNIQPIRYHPFDTFTHTLLTLHALQKINDNYLLKVAMLYHDVGKPQQYAYISEQKIKNTENIDMSNYIHHTESGLPLTKKDLQNLGFTKKEQEDILRYIKRHHRPHEILESTPKKREKKLRTMISDAGIEKVLALMDMVIADRLGQFNPLQKPATEGIYSLKDLAEKIYHQEGRFTMKELAIGGNNLITALHLSPGPQLGKILKQCFERTLSDIKTRNKKQLLLQYAKGLL